MNQETQDLVDQVTATKTVEESAIAVFATFEAKLTAAIDEADWAQVTSARDTLKTSSDALAAAIATVPA